MNQTYQLFIEKLRDLFQEEYDQGESIKFRLEQAIHFELLQLRTLAFYEVLEGSGSDDYREVLFDDIMNELDANFQNYGFDEDYAYDCWAQNGEI